MESDDVAKQKDEDAGSEKPRVVLNGDFLPAQFRTQSYDIARDVVRYVSRGDDYCQPPTRSSSIMRDLVKDAIRARAAMMNELVRTLDVHSREDLSLVKNVANSMFDDEQVTWGRIVTLHAFCGCLARYCESTHIPDCADDIGNILGDFVVHRLGLWIVTHGGWVRVQSAVFAVAAHSMQLSHAIDVSSPLLPPTMLCHCLDIPSPDKPPPSPFDTRQ